VIEAIYTDFNSNLRSTGKFTLRENRLLFHFVQRNFELESVLDIRSSTFFRHSSFDICHSLRILCLLPTAYSSLSIMYISICIHWPDCKRKILFWVRSPCGATT
jgi:hypothetical protein